MCPTRNGFSTSNNREIVFPFERNLGEKVNKVFLCFLCVFLFLLHQVRGTHVPLDRFRTILLRVHFFVYSLPQQLVFTCQRFVINYTPRGRKSSGRPPLPTFPLITLTSLLITPEGSYKHLWQQTFHDVLKTFARQKRRKTYPSIVIFHPSRRKKNWIFFCGVKCVSITVVIGLYFHFLFFFFGGGAASRKWLSSFYSSAVFVKDCFWHSRQDGCVSRADTIAVTPAFR